ncbi:MAG: hypothetical protein EP350_04470 [Alphaproteobacteria bacterium]|nr:MAG: hypothetical protein EP350_04470 [Alphaproteobacteria bacterium]
MAIRSVAPDGGCGRGGITVTLTGGGGGGGGGGGEGGGVAQAPSAAMPTATAKIRRFAPDVLPIAYPLICVACIICRQSLTQAEAAGLTRVSGKENARSAKGTPGIDETSLSCGYSRLPMKRSRKRNMLMKSR